MGSEMAAYSLSYTPFIIITYFFQECTPILKKTGENPCEFSRVFLDIADEKAERTKNRRRGPVNRGYFTFFWSSRLRETGINDIIFSSNILF
jgi:hypothetical protein